jgi:glycosyltransferase involved in cell wall biosynthesis
MVSDELSRPAVLGVAPREPQRRPIYSVVVPVYRNEESLAAVVEQLDGLADELDGALEAVFVVDGSPDASVLLLRRLLAEKHRFSSQLIALSRNFGSFSAVRAGLAAAEGDYLAMMAADLQEPISLVRDFFRGLSGGEHDIAIGVRIARDDPVRDMLPARIFWWLYRHLVERAIPPGGVDVFGCTRQVADQLLRLHESHTSLVGLLYWVGFRRLEVPYERQPRLVGTSGWGFRRKMRYLLDSIFSFTDLPITAIMVIGAIGVAVSTVWSIIVIVAWAAGKINVPGYTPLMLALFFVTSTVLIALGLVGSYVWRTYENSKGRPSVVPMTHERFNLDGAGDSTPIAPD